MNKQDIKDAIKHLQSSIKHRSGIIQIYHEAIIPDSLELAKQATNRYDPWEKRYWRDYHSGKEYLAYLVKQQCIEKKMLKFFYHADKQTDKRHAVLPIGDKLFYTVNLEQYYQVSLHNSAS